MYVKIVLCVETRVVLQLAIMSRNRAVVVVLLSRTCDPGHFFCRGMTCTGFFFMNAIVIVQVQFSTLMVMHVLIIILIIIYFKYIMKI